MTWIGRLPVTATALLALLPPAASAHPLTFTDTTVVLQRNGTFQADLVVDLDALALGAPQSADDAELVAALRGLSPAEFETAVERLRRLFQRRVRLRFDGDPAPFDVSFPDYGAPAATESTIPTVLGLTARLTGAVPAGATELEFFASRAFAEVNLTIRDDRRGVTRQTLLERGARSDPFPLSGPAAPPGAWSAAGRYLRLGFVHILPRGMDHILFVLGLFLLGARLRPLVWQVSAFTVAHAVTLSLAIFDVVSLPTRVVEPLIALSIVYVAVENVLTDRLTPWRPATVFLFGLLHGLGFAGDRVPVRPAARVGVRGRPARAGAAGGGTLARAADLQRGDRAGPTGGHRDRAGRGGLVPAPSVVPAPGGDPGIGSHRRHRTPLDPRTGRRRRRSVMHAAAAGRPARLDSTHPACWKVTVRASLPRELE
jgi:hypothetical protein